MSSVRNASESCWPEANEYDSSTFAWMTVPEGSGTDDCTPSVAVEVPPVGEIEGGFSEPLAVDPVGSVTIETPGSGCPADGTDGAVLPASGITKAKSPIDG